MYVAKAFWQLTKQTNEPYSEYYDTSEKTPYERGMDALNYYRYYGGKPIHTDKTYFNQLLMPIFEDLDYFHLRMTKFFLDIKNIQNNFDAGEASLDLLNFSHTLSSNLKNNLKERKNKFKDIYNELKDTNKEVKIIMKESLNQRKIFLPFVTFMEYREVKNQDIMKNIGSQFKKNARKLKLLRDHICVVEDEKKKSDNEIEKNKFNDYVRDFKFGLDSRLRKARIERLKIKIDEMQVIDQNEKIQKNEIKKQGRFIDILRHYSYKNYQKTDNTNIKSSLGNSSDKKKSKKSKNSNNKKSSLLSSEKYSWKSESYSKLFNGSGGEK